MQDNTVCEYHIFFDPTADDGRPREERARAELDACRAALVALAGRLAPRLAAAAWHCEPFVLWVWDPDDPASRRGWPRPEVENKWLWQTGKKNPVKLEALKIYESDHCTTTIKKE